jgi:hypothetical protein
MTRHGAAVIALLLAGCSTKPPDAIRTPQQAMAIALASECAAAQANLMRGEKTTGTWTAKRVGARWHIWLPPDPDGPDKAKGAWVKGAWLDAKDGHVDHCELRILN